MERFPTRVWHLSMASPADLCPAAAPGADVWAAVSGHPLGALNRWFYVEAGRDHHWVDRLPWTREQWQRFAERPAVETWIVWDRGTPCGYGELEWRPGGSVHLLMFGILPEFRGRGLGGHLLTEVVRRAWDSGALRVTLETCELDGPRALPNYRARGFRVDREAVEPRGRALERR